MKPTIDNAGRLAIPKALRDRLALSPGEVDVSVDGAGLRVEPLATEHLVERSGRSVAPAMGSALTDDDIGHCVSPTSADGIALLDTSAAIALLVLIMIIMAARSTPWLPNPQMSTAQVKASSSVSDRDLGMCATCSRPSGRTSCREWLSISASMCSASAKA